MPKRPNIRWRDSDDKELRRLRKNAAEKARRDRAKLLKQNKLFEAAQVPEIPTVRELRANIGTRKDFNEATRQLATYSKTGRTYEIDKNLEKSLHATVRDFKGKTNRLIKEAKTKREKALLRSALPDDITVNDIVKLSKSKEALRENIKLFKEYLRPGAEEIITLDDTKFNTKITRWQKETGERLAEVVNKNRAKERKEWEDAEVLYGGRKAGYTHAEIGMSAKKFSEFRDVEPHSYSSTASDIKARFKSLLKEVQPEYWDSRTKLAKDNYIGVLERYIGNTEKGKELIKQVKDAPLGDFKRTLTSEDDLFQDIYDIDKQPEKKNELIEKIWAEWNPTTVME